MKVGIFGSTGLVANALLERSNPVINWHVYGSVKPKSTCTFYPRIEDDGSILNCFLNTVDTVIYNANIGTPVDSSADFPENVFQNISLFLKFMSAVKNLNFKRPRIVFISSGGAVYGNFEPIYGGIRESDYCDPITPYGIHKFSMERLLQFASKEFGFFWNIIRPSNLYGSLLEHDRNQGVIGVWAKNILSGKSISLPSNPNIIRDYLHIDDFCTALELVVGYHSAVDKVYNVSTNVGSSLIDILNVFSEHYSDIKIKNRKFYQNSIMWNVLNHDLISETVFWKPKYNLHAGISEMLSRYQKI